MITATLNKLVKTAKVFVIKKPSKGYFLAVASDDELADFEILDGESYSTKIQASMRAQQLMGYHD